MRKQMEVTSFSNKLTLLLRSLSAKLAGVVVLIGVVGMFGWMLNIPILKSFLPNLPAIKVNTSLCFILAGIALHLWHRQFTGGKERIHRIRQGIIFGCSCFIIAIAALTLIEYALNTDWSIDQLLLQQPESLSGTMIAGRMAASTAIFLLLDGLVLLLLSVQSPNILVVQGMSIIVWLLSFFVLLSHLYGSVYFYTAQLHAGMAFPTAIAFQCLNLGILCTYPEQGVMALIIGDRAGSAIIRRLLPLAIVLPPLLGGVCVWGYHYHLYTEEVGIALANTLDVLLFLGLIIWNASKLNRLDTRWKHAEQALKQTNSELEQRVEARTIELQQLTDALEARVAERTADLQAMNDRWHLEFLLRERAARLQQESEQRFRAIFDTSFQFTGLLTPEGILLEVNQTTLNFGGLQRQEVVNRPFWEARLWTISLETQAQLKQAIEQAASGQFVRYEVEVQGAGDTTTIIDFSLKPIFDEAGKVKLLIPEGRDISERKRIEKHLALQSTIVNKMAEGVCLIRAADRRIIYANPKFERMFGYEPGELNNQPVSVVNYVSDESTVEQITSDIIAQIKQTGEAVYEVQNCQKDGSPFWCRARTTVFDHPDQGTVFVAVHTDITRHRQAELELQWQKDLRETIYNESADALFLVDPVTLLTTDCNRRAVELFEADCKADLIGIEGQTLQRRLFTEEGLAEITTAMREKGYWSLELEYVTCKGNFFWGNIAAKPVKIADQLLNLVRVTDITDRKQTELALRESQNKYQTLFSTFPIGISITDAQGQIVEANQASEDLLGLTHSEHLHRKYDAPDWQIIRPDGTPMPAKEYASVRALQENRFIHDVEKGIVRADGSVRWISVSAAPIPLEQYGVAIAYIDITERKQAELALHRYERIVTATTDGICLIDRNYTYQVVNQAYLSWHQKSKDEIIGRTLSEVLGVQLFETQLKAKLDQALAGETPQYQLWVDYPKGRLFVSITYSPYYELDRSISGVVVSLRDVTELKQVEEALRLSEERLQLALEASGEGLWDWYIETNKVFLDDRYQEMLGYEPGELGDTLADWASWIHPDDRAWVVELLQAHLKDSSVQYAFDYRVRTKSGDWKWIADYGKVVIRDAEGKPLRMIGTHRDITDRKQAEQKIRASEARYRAIVEDQTELICRFLPDGTILFINDAYCRYFGINREEWMGKSYQPVVYEEDQAQVTQLVNSMTPENPTVVIENRVVVNGQIRWTQWSNRMICDAQGNLIEYQSVGRDITDRKAVEIELQHAKEAAEAASQAKSMFLANMSHELRTPLNVILGFTQVLHRDPTLSSDHRETIQIIYRSGEHLLGLINDILDLSKIEAGRITLEANNVDIMALLGSLQDMLAYRAESKGLQFHVDVALDVPKCIVTDAQKLRQILINLLSNAIKFTEEGSVTLRVRVGETGRVEESEKVGSSRYAASRHLITSASYVPMLLSAESFSSSSAQPPIQLLFEVEDTGMGIAEDEINSIFDAFVQSASTEKMPEGTGLGLTIMLRFVELMNGQVWVSSTFGQGSLFQVQIPVQLANAEDQPQFSAHRHVVRLAPGQPTYRILVVDDQPDNRLLLTRLMMQLGFAVKEATNGQEAIDLWQQWRPHLIWMDIRMPVLNGYEATRRIHADPDRSLTKIIALTAYASMGDRTLALAAGCDDYITKPFKEEELLTKMATYLGLTYEYAENVSASAGELADRPNGFKLTAESLAVMPTDWITALYRAALNCDDEEVAHLITQIPSSHAVLATALNRLLRDYQFPQIMQLARPAADAPDP